jgi:hypothetical protein
MIKNPDTQTTDLDLDFGEIVGKKEDIHPPTVKKVAPLLNTEVKLTGILLAIPLKGSNHWIIKDLAECSGQEFLQWCHRYHPHNIITAERFEDINVRQRTYDQVKAFHLSLMNETSRNSRN